MQNQPRKCEKQESAMAQLKSQSKNQNLAKNNMTPEDDAFDIWTKAGSAGMHKYLKGSNEHKSQFWTAGAGWYAQNLRDEQLDLISYLHHLSERINSLQVLALMMENDDVSLRDAAIILKTLVSDKAPQNLPHQSND